MLEGPRPNIVYLGFNDPRRYIRGVENVISLLAKSASSRCYYIYRGDKTEIHRWGRIIAIAIPYNYLIGFFVLNLVILKIKTYRDVIVHGNSYYLSMMYVGRNLVFTIYDGLTYLKTLSGSRKSWLFASIELFIYFRSKQIHSISFFTWKQARFSERFARKVSVIYCSDAHEPAQLETDLQYVPVAAQSYFFAVRSIEKRANIDLLLDLAELLGKSCCNPDIIVAGKGPLLSYYREQVLHRDLSNIKFLGYVSDYDLDGLYRGAKCVLVPALFGEGFGLPIIEAYARGTPVAAADICAIPEVIFAQTHLFTNEVASVIRAVDAACAIPRSDYVAYYRKRFAADLIKKQYANFYAKLPRNVHVV